MAPKFGEIPKLMIIYYESDRGLVSKRARVTEDGTHTIGSCGTGLGPIFTLSSAAVPAAFIVHADLLLLIQVMYCGEQKVSHQPTLRRGEKGAYSAVFCEPGLVLEAVHGVATGVEFVTIGICDLYCHQHSNIQRKRILLIG